MNPTPSPTDIKPKTIERFWKRVNKNGPIQPHTPQLGNCWEWIGGMSDTGYGTVCVNSKNMNAHRFSFIIHNGSAPADLDILHKCDNRACVNPSHLFTGTAKANADDCESKGRRPKGSGKVQSKLTEPQVLFIRESASQGITHLSLAKQYSVSEEAIRLIVNRKRWTHI